MWDSLFNAYDTHGTEYVLIFVCYTEHAGHCTEYVVRYSPGVDADEASSVMELL